MHVKKIEKNHNVDFNNKQELLQKL
jgi:hypothetical protein